MKFIIVLVVVFAIALAEVEIVQRDIDVQPDGFKFHSATSDGSQHNAEGQLLNIGSENEEISVHGSYSYVGDDGITYTVNYIADKNGFQPQGAHIPVVAGA